MQTVQAQPPAAPAVPIAPAAPTAPVPPGLAPGGEQLAVITAQADPPVPGVQVADRFFGSLDGAVIAVVIALALVLLARLIQSLLIHLALRKALTLKSPIAAELAEKINRPFERAEPAETSGDDRNGLVLIAIGLAMGCFGLVIGDDAVLRIAVGSGFFPLFVGAALLIRRQLIKRAELRGLKF